MKRTSLRLPWQILSCGVRRCKSGSGAICGGWSHKSAHCMEGECQVAGNAKPKSEALGNSGTSTRSFRRGYIDTEMSSELCNCFSRVIKGQKTELCSFIVCLKPNINQLALSNPNRHESQ